MSVPIMETRMEPRQPSLFEKKTNTRLAWARLVGHVRLARFFVVGRAVLPAAGVNSQEL